MSLAPDHICQQSLTVLPLHCVPMWMTPPLVVLRSSTPIPATIPSACVTAIASQNRLASSLVAPQSASCCSQGDLFLMCLPPSRLCSHLQWLPSPPIRYKSKEIFQEQEHFKSNKCILDNYPNVIKSMRLGYSFVCFFKKIALTICTCNSLYHYPMFKALFLTQSKYLLQGVNVEWMDR